MEMTLLTLEPISLAHPTVVLRVREALPRNLKERIVPLIVMQRDMSNLSILARILNGTKYLQSTTSIPANTIPEMIPSL